MNNIGSNKNGKNQKNNLSGGLNNLPNLTKKSSNKKNNNSFTTTRPPANLGQNKGGGKGHG